MLGKTCTCLAAGGMPCTGSSAVWVDCMYCWFAICTWIGVVVGCTFINSADGAKWCPVLPESIKVGGGAGPSVVGSMLTLLLTLSSQLGVLGVPPSQALALGPSLGPSLSLLRCMRVCRWFGLKHWLVPLGFGDVTVASVVLQIGECGCFHVAICGCGVHLALVWLQMPWDQQ
jgi:hypothetical protein